MQIDFSVAFDHISLLSFLLKLRDVEVGILTLRVQKVVDDDVHIEKCKVLFRIPQGSVLCPLLIFL